jgi:hypothetical protein
MSVIIKGGDSTNLASVDNSNNLMVNTPGYGATGASRGGGPSNAGSIVFFSENDPGTVTGERYVYSPETDEDFRLRVASDNMMDVETFNYTTQNTGKHTYSTSTLTATWNTSGLRTNGGAVTTTGGLAFGTYAEFPIFGANNLYVEFEGSFNEQPATNVIIDFGMFRRGSATAYAPTDGIFFRLTSAGMIGVINYNASETTTSVFPFTYVNNQKYQFIILINQRTVQFWIDEVLYGEIPTPIGQSQPALSSTLPLSIRHAHTTTAGAVLSFYLNNYNISIGGVNMARQLGDLGNSMLGSYQTLSGFASTHGSLSLYTNSTNPTAAVPANASLTANLPSGLGGQAWETFTLAVNTDAILLQYLVPAGTAAIQGKRLRISGVKLSSFVQTALAGGPLVRTFSLAFGGTTATLAGSEAATTKNRRIVLLPELTQIVTAAQAVSTSISQPGGAISSFDQPIYVNPGEYVSVCVKHIGTVGSSGVIATNIQLVYSWE